MNQTSHFTTNISHIPRALWQSQNCLHASHFRPQTPEKKSPAYIMNYKSEECASKTLPGPKGNGAKSRPSQVNANEHAFSGWISVDHSRNRIPTSLAHPLTHSPRRTHKCTLVFNFCRLIMRRSGFPTYIYLSFFAQCSCSRSRSHTAAIGQISSNGF